MTNVVVGDQVDKDPNRQNMPSLEISRHNGGHGLVPGGDEDRGRQLVNVDVEGFTESYSRGG